MWIKGLPAFDTIFSKKLLCGSDCFRYLSKMSTLFVLKSRAVPEAELLGRWSDGHDRYVRESPHDEVVSIKKYVHTERL